MIYLLLTVLTTLSIMMIFKWFPKFGIDSFQAIVFNYFTCILVGYFYLDDKAGLHASFSNGMPIWGYWALGMGIMFIFSFYMIARTTQKAGVTVSSVASKISMAIPILISLFLLQTSTKTFTWINYLGIFGAFIAVVLTSLKNTNTTKSASTTSYSILLPIAVFITTGTSDAVLNYVNLSLLKPGEEGFFSVALFGFATVAGICIFFIGLALGKIKFQLKNMLAGFILGVPNYFSIYFLIKALSEFNNDGAFFFPILNISVILASMIVALALFKEKLSKLNLIGLVLAAGSIIMLSYQELFN